MKKVAIIMGSDSDWPVVKSACTVLKDFGIPFEAHILSAHRTPEAAADFAKSARANGYGVILCAAGMAAHLAGAFAANTTLPVVGIPMKGGALDGLDALLATVQMPSGFPVATVALNGAKNAAYLAVAILAVADDDLAAKLDKFRADTAAAIAKKDAAIAAEAAALTGKETLLDLYCGTGTIGLSMAARAAQVIGVEVVPQAVEDARRNAADNGIENARFLCADAGQAAARLRAEGVRPDVVVLDPPRKGCDEAVVDTVALMAPSRVVYVSCDPATLARDLRVFGERGYAVRQVTPVDMFPRTAHVECVALLTRTDL